MAARAELRLRVRATSRLHLGRHLDEHLELVVVDYAVARDVEVMEERLDGAEVLVGQLAYFIDKMIR